MNEITVSAVRTDVLRQMDLNPVKAAMPQRAERAERFRLERDRLLCLGAGYLIMKAAGIRSEADIRLGENGKPYVPGHPPFSISHSSRWCILASGTKRTIGADIEALDPQQLDIAPSVYTPGELTWMEEDPLNRFFRLWTWKESLMKATGLGMALEPKSFETLPFAFAHPLRLLGQEWYAQTATLNGYIFSVCADEPVGPLRWVEYQSPLE